MLFAFYLQFRTIELCENILPFDVTINLIANINKIINIPSSNGFLAGIFSI